MEKIRIRDGKKSDPQYCPMFRSARNYIADFLTRKSIVHDGMFLFGTLLPACQLAGNFTISCFVSPVAVPAFPALLGC
jgi:hypothetical protein